MHIQRQLAHLVEEQGAAVGLHKLTRVLLRRAGEAALFVAEQDRLDQVCRNGPAVDGDERLAGAVRGAMNGARDQFLANAAFAGHEHRDRAFRRPFAQAFDHRHGRARADQVREGGLVTDMLLEAIDLALEVTHR